MNKTISELESLWNAFLTVSMVAKQRRNERWKMMKMKGSVTVSDRYLLKRKWLRQRWSVIQLNELNVSVIYVPVGKMQPVESLHSVQANNIKATYWRFCFSFSEQYWWLFTSHFTVNKIIIINIIIIINDNNCIKRWQCYSLFLQNKAI